MSDGSVWQWALDRGSDVYAQLVARPFAWHEWTLVVVVLLLVRAALSRAPPRHALPTGPSWLATASALLGDKVRFLARLAEWELQYGPVYSMSCPLLGEFFVTSDTHLGLAMMNRPLFDTSQENKHAFRQVGGENLGSLTGDERSVHKQLLMTAITAQDSQATFVVSIMDEWCASLPVDARAGASTTFDNFYPHLFDMQGELLSRLAFAFSLRSFTARDSNTGSAVRELMQSYGEMLASGMPPNVWNVLHPREWWRNSQRRTIVFSFISSLLRERQAHCQLDSTLADTRHIADRLTVARRHNGERLDFTAIRDELFAWWFGAYETVVATLSFVLWAFGTHADEQRKVQRAIDDFYRRHPDGPTCLAEMGVDECVELDYFLRETLRHYPIGPLIARFVNGRAAETVTYRDADGVDHPYDLPAHTGVFVLTRQMMMRDTRTTRPDVFNPDRYRTEQPLWLPFGHGERKCPGGDIFAMYHMRTTLFVLLRNFTVELTRPSDEYKPSFNVAYNIADLPLKLTRRK